MTHLSSFAHQPEPVEDLRLGGHRVDQMVGRQEQEWVSELLEQPDVAGGRDLCFFG